MALPASGPITSDDIQDEFNQTVGSSFDVEDYYRNAGIVPSTSGVSGGVAEVQSVDFSGATSNTFSAEQDELVSITLNSDFNSGNSDPPEYTFSLDTQGTTFSSTPITGSFLFNQNADQALTALATAITDNYSGTTASSISTVPLVGMDITIDLSIIGYPAETGSARNTGRNLLELNTTLDNVLFVLLPLNTTFSSASELATAFQDEAEFSTRANQVITDGVQGNYSIVADGDTIRMTSTDSFMASMFDRMELYLPNFLADADLLVTDNHTGTSFGPGRRIEVSSGFPVARRITIDTNQTADISQELTLDVNLGTNTEFYLTAVHGSSTASGTASTYTISDYSGTEIASLTATSGETLTSILGRLETIVDDNTETPIDFMSQVFVGNRLILTAQSVGSLNPGEPSTAQWTVTVNHNSGDGDIAVSGFTRSTRGRDTLSNINTNVPTSGAITFDNFHGATLGDN